MLISQMRKLRPTNTALPRVRQFTLICVLTVVGTVVTQIYTHMKIHRTTAPKESPLDRKNTISFLKSKMSGMRNILRKTLN